METRFYNAKLIKAAKIFHRGLPGPKRTVDHKAKELKNEATLVKKKTSWTACTYQSDSRFLICGETDFV